MILYIKHVEIEGPETIGQFFRAQGFSGRIIDLGRGESLPSTLDDIDAVVCLGGPMNVYEEDRYPYLCKENEFIQQVLSRKIPYLGICLGAQLLAKAAGAKVVRSPNEEIGWRTVQLTNQGKMDVLFQGIKESFTVFQWHGDMFEIPGQGQLLATGPDCPNQALKVGPCAYGLQFHIEITGQSIREWSEEYFANDEERRERERGHMLASYEKSHNLFDQQAQIIYNNFLNLIDCGKEASPKGKNA